MLGEPLYRAPFVAELLACTKCTCRAEASQVVPGIGPQSAKLLFIGQNPGGDEDRDGVPFVGASGDELEKWLAILGVTRNDVAITNVVKCHTTDNRIPRAGEIDTCIEAWLPKELAYLTDLRIILPLGKPALKGLVGKDADLFPTMEFRTTELDIGGRAIQLVPLPHPAYLLRNPSDRPRFFGSVLSEVRALVARVGSVYA